MQQQIRPHFSIVYTLAELGWTREAKKATMALASFYMRSMSGGTRSSRYEKRAK
ncbi:histidine kinase [Paenibacillus sp. FSL H7-0326]|uniref:histidine kinase n=1 Tax=Paenibacillus sp. FSL H7-0326 TaxID=1921144 RepID=UPI00117CE13F|nr:histidine kinase [Paenibacillus sp. FSL H7-0326]